MGMAGYTDGRTVTRGIGRCRTAEKTERVGMKEDSGQGNPTQGTYVWTERRLRTDEGKRPSVHHLPIARKQTVGVERRGIPP